MSATIRSRTSDLRTPLARRHCTHAGQESWARKGRGQCSVVTVSGSGRALSTLVFPSAQPPLNSEPSGLLSRELERLLHDCQSPASVQPLMGTVSKSPAGNLAHAITSHLKSESRPKRCHALLCIPSLLPFWESESTGADSCCELLPLLPWEQTFFRDPAVLSLSAAAS